MEAIGKKKAPREGGAKFEVGAARRSVASRTRREAAILEAVRLILVTHNGKS